MACPSHANEIQSTVELREDAYVNLRAPAVCVVLLWHVFTACKTLRCTFGSGPGARFTKIIPPLDPPLRKVPNEALSLSLWDPETFALGRRHVPRGAPSLGSG
jgi:hypothetical protein